MKIVLNVLKILPKFLVVIVLSTIWGFDQSLFYLIELWLILISYEILCHAFKFTFDNLDLGID